jgi:glyoxylase-like metal-dependent hydrolase (beta-lactamase superfamily II)
MFIEKVKTEGLAHLSYVLGSEGEAAVIDPRRDCGVYIEIATAHGCRIGHIFETHRNEDLLSGAAALAGMTGATVHHGPNAAGAVRYCRATIEKAVGSAYQSTWKPRLTIRPSGNLRPSILVTSRADAISKFKYLNIVIPRLA